MPYLDFLLVEPRYTYVELAGRLVHRIWFKGNLTQSELATEDHEGTHHITDCVVTFTDGRDACASGELKYQSAWRDPETDKLYSGTCELQFTVSTDLMVFLDSFAAREMELHLRALLEAQHPAVHRLGNDVSWHPSHQNPLPAKLESIGFVPSDKGSQFRA